MTAPVVEDSRNRGGVLLLDGIAFGKQMTSVELEPSTDTEGDPVETLSAPAIPADEVTSWVLNLGAIQDFDDRAGFVEYARANAGDVVPFSWTPNSAESPTYTGTVKVRAVKIGGEVAKRLSTETGWQVVGDPIVTYPA